MLVVPYGGADGKMSHMHFGRAVPVTFRRFPSLACHNLLGKTVRVPEDLEGRLNVLVVGFKASHYMGMNSWMPLANRLKKELLIKHKTDESLVQVYRLVIRQKGGIFLRWWTDERLRLAVGDGTFEIGELGEKQGITDDEPTRADAGYAAEGCTLSPSAKTPNESNLSVVPDDTPDALRASKLQRVRSRTLVCFTDKSAFVEALQLADAQRVYIFLVDREGEIAWCEHEQYSPPKEMEVRELLRLPAPGTPALPQASGDMRPLPAYLERE